MQKRKMHRIAMVLVLCLSVVLIAQATSPGTWTFTGSMNTGRYVHTATLLTNGMVLISGGSNGNFTSRAELYNPATGAFTATGNMNTAREGHTATLLNNGMVLITGGYGGVFGSATYLSSAELYNPATGEFTFTGSMHAGRYEHTATLLNNGMVLVAGGDSGSGSGNSIASAELYNPATGTFTLTGSLNAARFSHTAVLLDNGIVLITGGTTSCPFTCAPPLASAELYNPATGTFTFTGSLNNARYDHTAILLNNGTALIAGGIGRSNYLGSAELYNPVTGTFTLTGSLNTTRFDHTATLLNDGMALIAGGRGTNNDVVLASAELYNPATGTFTFTGSLNTGRYDNTATLLNNGNVLAAAGLGGGGILSSAELYQPSNLTPSGLQSVALTPNPWLPVGSSMPLIATGTFNGGGTEQLASVTWSSSNTAVATITNDSGDSGTNSSANRGNAYGVAAGTTTIKACAGSICGSTTLTVAEHANLVIGSQPTDGSRATFEKYDDSGKLLLTGNLSIPRADHTATLLSNGQIFLAGGTDDDTSWQTFDQNGNVLGSGLLQDGRILQAATLLANGNVFLAGGTASPGTWEIHSPTGALVASGNLSGSRTAGVSAVTLKNGNVWVSGSASANGDACTWEIRNSSGALVSSGSLNSCFGAGQVQALNNGNVILLGGGNAPGTWEIRSQTGTFISTGSLNSAFNIGASSALLNNGDVFIFGSCFEMNPEPPDPNSCGTQGAPSTWEIRDQNGNFVSTGSLFSPRDTAGAVVLSNGNVLITGGASTPDAWEIRSGANGSLVTQGSLFDSRSAGHTLTHF